LERHPLALQRVAMATGLHVVMGTSWFTKAWHPANMDSRSVENLTEEIVREVTTGVGDTGIRPGIIGEVGAQGGPLTPNEEKVLRASGRASRLTGAAVTLHTQAQQREQPKILDLLEAEGADLARVVVGHSNPLAKDLSFAKQLLARGVYIQFDTLGRTPRVNDPMSVSDTEVARGVVDLITAGYVERILLAQDVCTKIQLKSYGGSGYSYVLERFVPYLKRLGVSAAQIDTILVENPKRVLTFRAPLQARKAE
jgi:phosphotriesterase-related protein